MKKVMLTLGTAAVAIMFFAATSLQAPTPVAASETVVAEAAAGAFVLNKPDGLGCTAGVGGYLAAGPATLVVTPSGKVTFSCQADVLAGPPLPNNTLRFTGVPGPFGSSCNVVINPAGNLNASCHN